MINRIKAFILATSLLLTSCVGSLDLKILQKPNLEAPREAYVNIEKTTTYRACLNRKGYINFMETKFGMSATPEMKNDPDPLFCSTAESHHSASGVHIQKHISKTTKELSSVILTAYHFCGGDIEDPTEIIEEGTMQFLEEFTVEKAFVVKDYRGVEVEMINSEPLVFSGESDTCLLETKLIEYKPIEVSNKGLYYGERVLNVSTPYNRYMPPNIILNEGLYIGPHESGYLMISDMDLGPGSSGSMIVVRRQNKWELVGMVIAVSLVYDSPVGIDSRFIKVGEVILTLGASAQQIKELIKEKH